MKNELILAFDADVVNALYNEGMNKEWDMDNLAPSVIIQPRYVAETSTTTRHPIPYTVMFDSGTREILLYRRGAKVGENRLSGNASCGFGGHVDIDGDLLQVATGENNFFSPNAAVMYTADKELEEELGKDFRKCKTSIVGILRDDSNEVGKVHLGVVMVKYILRELIEDTNEQELNFIGWTKLSDIDVDDPTLNLENWSKLVISYLQENL